MKIEADILYIYKCERYDLMRKGKAIENTKYGKGLFARTNIPKNTVLAYYPGDRLSAEESLDRKNEREEGDRFVFEYKLQCGKQLL